MLLRILNAAFGDTDRPLEYWDAYDDTIGLAKFVRLGAVPGSLSMYLDAVGLIAYFGLIQPSSPARLGGGASASRTPRLLEPPTMPWLPALTLLAAANAILLIAIAVAPIARRLGLRTWKIRHARIVARVRRQLDRPDGGSRVETLLQGADEAAVLESMSAIGRAPASIRQRSSRSPGWCRNQRRGFACRHPGRVSRSSMPALKLRRSCAATRRLMSVRWWCTQRRSIGLARCRSPPGRSCSEPWRTLTRWFASRR